MDGLEQAKQLNMLNNSIKFVGPTHILFTKKGLFFKGNQSLFLKMCKHSQPSTTCFTSKAPPQWQGLF
jgi:hypothetical protein